MSELYVRQAGSTSIESGRGTYLLALLFGRGGPTLYRGDRVAPDGDDFLVGAQSPTLPTLANYWFSLASHLLFVLAILTSYPGGVKVLLYL